MDNDKFDIPKAKVGKHMNYPELEEMKVGQRAVYDLQFSSQIRAACSYVTRKTGKKFVTRSNHKMNEFTVILIEDSN